LETTFDHDGLVANAGLIVTATLMARLGLEALVNEHVRTGSANPGRKLLTLVAAMLAGATHIDHVDMLPGECCRLSSRHRRRSARSCGASRSDVDPDSEIITDTTVTPGNAGDASVAENLIEDLLDDGDRPGDATVYGDSAYGTGEFQQRLDDEGIASGCRTQPPSAPAGRFGKDRFEVNLVADTITCPNNVTVRVRRGVHGDGIASFAEHCVTCPLRAECTNATGGRTIRVSPFEAALARARQRQTDPDWQAGYRANRPKVERKLAHLMRRRHGGRRARVRGQPKVDADFNLLAAAANVARLAALGLRSTTTGWATTT
jgi:hypothetical protein